MRLIDRLGTAPSWYASPAAGLAAARFAQGVAAAVPVLVLLALAAPASWWMRVVVLGLWSLVPPVALAYEHLVHFDNWGNPAAAARFRDVQILLGRVWLGIMLYLTMIFHMIASVSF